MPILPTYRCIKMPLGASDRSLIQYVKDIEDKKNNAHFILCKNYSGDHPNAPDMSGTVRWVRGGVTREYSIVFTHTHTHMTSEHTMQYILYLNLFDSAQYIQLCRAETMFAGVIVRPDSSDPDSTQLSMLFQTDMKGWIPAFIVNLFSARAPKQWQEQVTEYYHNGYHQ